MPQYNWLTFGAAKTNLSQRLADPAFQFWTDIECGLCLIEALRAWNAYTEIWNADFTFTASSASHWYDLATLSGSPRLRTVSDSDLYTMMQYHLLEPPTGAGAWTGTSQFSLADLQGALQRRRDEMIQVSGCNLAHLAPLNITPGTYTITLADNVLEPHRARFLPDVGNPVTLKREDRGAWNAFNPGRLQHPDVPAAWSILSGPPLSLDTDVPVSLPGQVDLIVLQSGNVFAPPAATLLNVPDDWAWVAKWGALADLLSRDSEATDLPRAQFCLQRYMDGLKAMRDANWLLEAHINGLLVDTPSLSEADRYSAEWEDDATAWPKVITAGVDVLGCCPIPAPGNDSSVVLTLVGNAPVPSVDEDLVQVSRDNFDAILSYAQFLAIFKMAGAEFQGALPLLQQFASAAQDTNARLEKMGILADILQSQGARESVAEPR